VSQEKLAKTIKLLDIKIYPDIIFALHACYLITNSLKGGEKQHV